MVKDGQNGNGAKTTRVTPSKGIMTTKEKELNDWIAVNVMGWERHQEKPYTPAAQKTVEALATWQDGDGKVMAFVKDYNPTTNPAAAFEVLKRCLDKTLLLKHTQTTGDGKYRIAIPLLFDEESPVIASADTLELCICQFAKKLFTKF